MGRDQRTRTEWVKKFGYCTQFSYQVISFYSELDANGTFPENPLADTLQAAKVKIIGNEECNK